MDASAINLWPLVQATTQSALSCGALKPIATQRYFITDHDIVFLVRVVDSIARKEAAQKSQPKDVTAQAFNPFLPYEEALFVGDISDTHVCLLNKFNVVDHHLLMVTRVYESQNDWLTLPDFAALAHCLLAVDGLGFYNSGANAGASQHHKHLQLIPFSEGEGVNTVPIATVISQHQEVLAHTHCLPQLPFLHSVRPLQQPWRMSDQPALAAALLATYQQIMVDLGMDLQTARPAQPYNLLMTRQWMMGVGRSQPTYGGIGVNALGYAGWLLVKDGDLLTQLQAIGPMTLLQAVGQPGR